MGNLRDRNKLGNFGLQSEIANDIADRFALLRLAIIGVSRIDPPEQLKALEYIEKEVIGFLLVLSRVVCTICGTTYTSHMRLHIDDEPEDAIYCHDSTGPLQPFRLDNKEEYRDGMHIETIKRVLLNLDFFATNASSAGEDNTAATHRWAYEKLCDVYGIPVDAPSEEK